MSAKLWPHVSHQRRTVSIRDDNAPLRQQQLDIPQAAAIDRTTRTGEPNASRLRGAVTGLAFGAGHGCVIDPKSGSWLVAAQTGLDVFQPMAVAASA